MSDEVNAVLARKRNPTIDGLKFIAAAAIVLHHVSGTALAARGGPAASFLVEATYPALFFFFAVSGYLHGAVANRGLDWLLRKRFARLAVPYAVWSIVYLGWDVFRAQLSHHPLSLPPLWQIVFFAGARQVLWSLPMLFLCAALAELFVKGPVQRRAFTAVFMAGAIWTCFFAPAAWAASPLVQFLLFARWPFIYGLGMEIRAASSSPRLWPALPLVACGGTIALGVIGALQFRGGAAAAIILALDSLVAAAALAGAHSGYGWFRVKNLAWGGPYLLGIYVSHYLWLEIVTRLVSPLRLPVLVWIPVAWVLVFALALGATRLLISSKYTRLTVT